MSNEKLSHRIDEFLETKKTQNQEIENLQHQQKSNIESKLNDSNFSLWEEKLQTYKNRADVKLVAVERQTTYTALRREAAQNIIVNHRTNSNEIGVGLLTRNSKYRSETKPKSRKPIKSRYQGRTTKNPTIPSEKGTEIAAARSAVQRGCAGNRRRSESLVCDGSLAATGWKVAASTSVVQGRSVGNGLRSNGRPPVFDGPLVCDEHMPVTGQNGETEVPINGDFGKTPIVAHDGEGSRHSRKVAEIVFQKPNERRGIAGSKGMGYLHELVGPENLKGVTGLGNRDGAEIQSPLNPKYSPFNFFLAHTLIIMLPLMLLMK
ncbi:hypothetical protein CASFOL_017257 [Castilleja foliolosa]|uniref:Uncharacterized protein n=1 Tax=Castilleja foliolosa TaxID=1961234 RepID=A0ABD3DAL8_9LAMI